MLLCYFNGLQTLPQFVCAVRCGETRHILNLLESKHINKRARSWQNRTILYAGSKRVCDLNTYRRKCEEQFGGSGKT